MKTPKLIRITTVPISLKLLITGQMKYMSENGFEVKMISAGGEEVNEVITKEGCPHIIVELTRAITPFQDLKCLWALFKLFRLEKPDIVHTHTPKAGLLGMMAAKLAGVPIRLHTVAGLPLMTANGFKKKLLFFIEKLTYLFSNKVMPNSNSLLRYIRTHRMTSEKKLHLLGGGSSNGIDLKQFSEKSIEANRLRILKNQINYSSENIYLIAVGRIVVDKGIIELISAFNVVQDYTPNLKLILLGPLEKERPEETLPSEILHTINNHPNIIHINWSDEVEYYLHLSNLLIHASYREGFPNVLLQAGAMNCPIICSNILGNIDIVDHENTGLLFDVKNASNLAERIKWSLDNPQAMKDFADRLYSKIQNNYSRTTFHNKMRNFYLKLLEKNE